jgi:hypothetical protein
MNLILRDVKTCMANIADKRDLKLKNKKLKKENANLKA